MSKKIIFFDVDGTLVDVRPAREYVPESTIKAVRETKKKGNHRQCGNHPKDAVRHRCPAGRKEQAGGRDGGACGNDTEHRG